MTIRQYIHRKKPGGYQKVTPGKWLTLGLAPTAATAGGLLIHKLYAHLIWDEEPAQAAYLTGFRVRYRLVRKNISKKQADPTGYDERTVLFDSVSNATHSIEYVGPVRKGEIGRPYYWQMMVIPPTMGFGGRIKNLKVTTRYTDMWRLT